MTAIKLFQVAITYNCNKSCSYCYAHNLRDEYDDMDIESFKQVLNWLEKNNIKKFNFTGGEPTLHPKIKEFVSLASERGFKLTILSNGIFPTDLIEALPDVESFLINYNPREHYSEEEYELLHKNLESLKKHNVKIMLQINITENLTSCEHVLKACKSFRVSQVNLDFIVPNALQSNSYIESADYQKKKALMLGFMEKLRKIGVRTKISRPMPKCCFTRQELKTLDNDTYFNCGSGNSIITVNPDLTTFPCLSIFFRGPKITSFRDVDAFRKFYEKSISQVKWKRKIYEKCGNCIYFARRQCQGACLGYKCKRFEIHKTDRYTIYSQFQLEEIQEFLRAVDKSINSLDQFLTRQRRAIIFLFDNKEDLFYYSGKYDYPAWVNGFVLNPNVYVQYGAKAGKDLVHELCHLYVRNWNLPTWLQEGFCQYMAKEDNTEQLRNLMKMKKIISFDSLSRTGSIGMLEFDADRIDMNICYQQSLNFVRFLVESFGIEKVKDLLTSNYDDFYSYFSHLTGADFASCEKRWIEHLETDSGN